MAQKTLDDVLAEVRRGTTIEAGVETLLTSLQAKIIAAGGDPAKIDAVFAELAANNDKTAAAIVANTPVDPAAGGGAGGGSGTGPV